MGQSISKYVVILGRVLGSLKATERLPQNDLWEINQKITEEWFINVDDKFELVECRNEWRALIKNLSIIQFFYLAYIILVVYIFF